MNRVCDAALSTYVHSPIPISSLPHIYSCSRYEREVCLGDVCLGVMCMPEGDSARRRNLMHAATGRFDVTDLDLDLVDLCACLRA